MYREADFTELRFGDVLQGFPLSSSNIQFPITKLNEGYDISTIIPEYCVVLDPCCSIGEGMISLTPLKQISTNLIDNPHLRADLTLINKEISSLEITHPQRWNQLSPAKKLDNMNKKASLGYYYNFIYEPHGLLKEYKLPFTHRFEQALDNDELPYFKRIREDWTYEDSHYMINFKEIYHLECKKIKKVGGKVSDAEILSAKRLELSDEARKAFKYKFHIYIEREN